MRFIVVTFFVAALIVLGFALPTSAQTAPSQCTKALDFAQAQYELGVDVASYNREEIQWLLAHASRPTTCAPVPADLVARMRGEYPVPKHHRRMNCHIAMDFLLETNEQGGDISDADREWAADYVDAVESGEQCDEIPRSLQLRAAGHEIGGADMKTFLASAMDDAEDSDAALEIGMAYALGTLVGKDANLAYSYLVRSSEMGNPWADLELANLYRAGKVESEPKSKALEYALKAANTGNPIGHVMVADLYETGDVVKRDKAKAVEHYLKAAERGELYAVLIAANLLFEGDGISKDTGRAIELARTAAHAGDTNAMLLLASMMLQDKKAKSLVKNEGEIWYWIERARDAGNPLAVSFLAEKRGELENAFTRAAYVPPKRQCREILVCDVYITQNGRKRDKICSTKRDWTTCDYSL